VFTRYARHGSVLVIPYVEAPPALRGTGAASQLMAGVMEIARTEGLKVRPLCSYASVWMHRHREYHDLLG
jgi:predicted GNAT family acetyltransferase